jgi:ribulose 1,5-bisphosphate synthetase/thiazole synthase
MEGVRLMAGRHIVRALLGLAVVFSLVGDVIAGADDEAIRGLLMDSFNRQEARLAVDPIVVANDHAIADWIQDNRGGRALLRRKAGQWVIVLCSGNGIKSADAMRLAGVPAADAAKLAASLESAEKTMPTDQLALLASFKGTVLMGPDGAHPSATHGAGAGHPSHGHPAVGK